MKPTCGPKQAKLSRWLIPAAFIACVQHAALPSAKASGNATARFGGEHGTVNATNPTALYYNPGALGFSEGIQLFIDGQLALRNLTWKHQPGPGDVDPPDGYADANYGTARASNWFGAPMLGFSMPLGKFVVGAAAYAPFGGSVSFDSDGSFASSEYPGAQAGVARWHGIEGSTSSIYATVGGAYRFGRVSVGLTANLIYTSLHLLRAQSLTGDNDVRNEGRSRLDVSGIYGSFGLGVMVEAIPERVFVGFSYQAQPGLGVQALDGVLKVDSSLQPDADSLTRKVTLYQALPDIFRLGVRYRIHPLTELRVATDYTRWSMLQTQCVAVRGQPCTVTADGDAAPNSGVVQNSRRHFRDTFGIRLGASRWVAPELELFAGLGFETGAAPDSTLDPLLADADNVAIALGASFEIAPGWSVAGTFTHLQFLPRDNTGKSQLSGPDVATITRRPDGGGKYNQSVEVLDINVTRYF